MAKFNARAYARLGQAGSIFGMSLMDNLEDNKIKVLSADMSVVAGLDRFKRTYPADFYNTSLPFSFCAYSVSDKRHTYSTGIAP